MDVYTKAKNEYSEQYPQEENPFSWGFLFDIDVILDFVEARQGRKVLLRTDSRQDDGGVLYYGKATK